MLRMLASILLISFCALAMDGSQTLFQPLFRSSAESVDDKTLVEEYEDDETQMKSSAQEDYKGKSSHAANPTLLQTSEQRKLLRKIRALSDSNTTSLSVINAVGELLENQSSQDTLSFYDLIRVPSFKAHLLKVLSSLKISCNSLSIMHFGNTLAPDNYLSLLIPSAKKFILECFIAHYCWNAAPIGSQALSTYKDENASAFKAESFPNDQDEHTFFKSDENEAWYSDDAHNGIQGWKWGCDDPADEAKLNERNKHYLQTRLKDERTLHLATLAIGLAPERNYSLAYDAKKDVFVVIGKTNQIHELPLEGPQGPYRKKVCENDKAAFDSCTIRTIDLKQNAVAIVFFWRQRLFRNIINRFLPDQFVAKSSWIDVFVLDINSFTCKHVFQKQIVYAMQNSNIFVQALFPSNKKKSFGNFRERFPFVGNSIIAFSSDLKGLCVLVQRYSLDVQLPTITSIEHVDFNKTDLEKRCPESVAFSRDSLRLFIVYAYCKNRFDNPSSSQLEIKDVATGVSLAVIKDNINNLLSFPTLLDQTTQLWLQCIISKIGLARRGTLIKTSLARAGHLISRGPKRALNDEQKPSNHTVQLIDTKEEYCDTTTIPLPLSFPENTTVWCLAINGEYMDTLTCAYMLDKIQKFTGRPMHELFDCIVGSSLGSLLAFGLTASVDGEKPLLSTKSLIDFFHALACNQRTAQTPHINEKSLHTLIRSLVEGTKLSNCVARVLVPYVEETVRPGAQSILKDSFFDRSEAQVREDQDFSLNYAIRSSISDNQHILAYKDKNIPKQRRANGLYKNNAAAFLYKKIFSDSPLDDLYIVSLSTGIINDNNCVTDSDLNKELGLRYKNIRPQRAIKVDDFSQAALEDAEKIADDAINNNKDILEQLKVMVFKKNNSAFGE